MPLTTPSAERLFALFPHERGPAAYRRVISLGELRESPCLWVGEFPLSSVADRDIAVLARSDPRRLRYFATVEPLHLAVTLLRVGLDQTTEPATPRSADQRLPDHGGIRDKFWQRLLVEDSGLLSQPGFVAVTGSRVESRNAPWLVDVEAVDCRPVREQLLAASAPGVVVVVEDVEAGFVATARDDGIHLASHSPHVVARLRGTPGGVLSIADWNRFVNDLCDHPLPIGLTKSVHNPTADLAAALQEAPGSYILKPRFGSNGFGVVRVVSHPDGNLSAESDCPDTARYLDEFPRDPAVRGRDLVTAVAEHRAQYIDRATAGLPERTLAQSILESEIRQDRADGSIFEPRVVVQRMGATGDRLATLGAVCKRIDTAVGASVARDFQEEPLDASLLRFLEGRVPGSDLEREVRRTSDTILAAADQLRSVVVPLVEASQARVHQFGIDCRGVVAGVQPPRVT